MSSEVQHDESGWFRLASVPAVRQQQAAFTCATGLPLTLLPTRQEAAKAEAGAAKKAFCVSGCMGGSSGAHCQRAMEQAEKRATTAHGPVTYQCPAGLTKILVPVLAGGEHVGNLLAGPFSVKEPDAALFRRITERLKHWGLDGRADKLDASWRHTPIIGADRSRAVATLVRMFADYLAECSHRLGLKSVRPSSPFMQKVEAFLTEQNGKEISLKTVAEYVSLSPCHFCKVFKKQTGQTFSEYRTRQRVEKVKRLLVEKGLRVSEAAFEAGFNSIPYFNRAFRRYEGCSPREYVAKTTGANGVK